MERLCVILLIISTEVEYMCCINSPFFNKKMSRFPSRELQKYFKRSTPHVHKEKSPPPNLIPSPPPNKSQIHHSYIDLVTNPFLNPPPPQTIHNQKYMYG